MSSWSEDFITILLTCIYIYTWVYSKGPPVCILLWYYAIPLCDNALYILSWSRHQWMYELCKTLNLSWEYAWHRPWLNMGWMYYQRWSAQPRLCTDGHSDISMIAPMQLDAILLCVWPICFIIPVIACVSVPFMEIIMYSATTESTEYRRWLAGPRLYQCHVTRGIN